MIQLLVRLLAFRHLRRLSSVWQKVAQTGNARADTCFCQTMFITNADKFGNAVLAKASESNKEPLRIQPYPCFYKKTLLFSLFLFDSDIQLCRHKNTLSGFPLRWISQRSSRSLAFVVVCCVRNCSMWIHWVDLGAAVHVISLDTMSATAWGSIRARRSWQTHQHILKQAGIRAANSPRLVSQTDIWCCLSSTSSFVCGNQMRPF